jgi:hypothetical protein
MDSEALAEASKIRIDPSVTVENKGKTSTVTIQDVDSLFQGIASYNDQFSLGKSIFSLIMQHFERNIEDEEGEESLALASKIDEQSQHMSASALSVIHEATLNNIGLSLEPVSGKSATIYSSEGAVGTGEMRLNIKDRDQFGAFLKALTPDQVSQTPLGGHLGELTGILNKQVLDNYDLEQPDDATLTFLGSLDGIIGEYRRLGLSEQADQMGEYLEHARAGNLREFVALKTSGLLQEPGQGFGPADWQKDANNEFLRRRWSEALQLLRAMRNNPNAGDMYQNLLTHLNKCIVIAQTNLPELQYYTPEAKQLLAEELSTAKEGLAAFEV